MGMSDWNFGISDKKVGCLCWTMGRASSCTSEMTELRAMQDWRDQITTSAMLVGASNRRDFKRVKVGEG
ncbi:MAG: hypothetical protein YPKNTGVA_002683 [Candidatus Fervidibacter sp.]|jgi:hypothetical protein